LQQRLYEDSARIGLVVEEWKKWTKEGAKNLSLLECSSSKV